MHNIDYLFVLILATVLPVAWTVEHQRWLRRVASGEAPNRVGVYHRTMLQLWTIFVVLALFWWWMRRPGADLGLIPPAGIGFWISAAIALAVSAVLIWSIHSAATIDSAKAKEQCRGFGDLYHFMPHTDKELRHFVGLSVTAGIVEEVIYRGYLMWVFSHYVPVWGAALAASLIFGLAHSYQGVAGVFRTGIIGLVLCGLFVLSGSLWVPIVAHVLLDALQGVGLVRIIRRASDDAR